METSRKVNVAEQLTRLRDLRSSGAISDDEFKRLKETIIATYTVSSSIHIDPMARQIGRSVPDGEIVAQAASFRALKAIAGVAGLCGIAYLIFTNSGQALLNSAITQTVSQVANEESPIKIEVSTKLFEGCQLSPFAPGCPAYSIVILNKGAPVRILKVVINKRPDVRGCVETPNRELNVGDQWETALHTECGQQIVHADISTDHGAEEYDFGQ